MSGPKIFSIIMATYNCGDKLEATLDSIFSQNNELFEMIVADGKSTDSTLANLKKYDGRLTLISEEDEGVFDAFNKAIDLAHGEYLYFIGAGDRLRSGVLNEIRELLPRGKKPAFVYGSSYLMQQGIVWQGREFSEGNFITGNICQQSIFYHRSIFNVLGKFKPQYKISSDWYLNVECFTCPVIDKHFVPIVIADYEEGGLSSVLSNDSAFVKDFPALIRKHYGLRMYLQRRLFVFNPNLYSLGYAFVRRLGLMARPYVRKLRYVRSKVRI